MVGGHVEGFAELADFHHLNGLVCGHFEYVEQLGERFVVAVVLDDLVDSAEIRSDVENGVFLVEQIDFDSASGEYSFVMVIILV